MSKQWKKVENKHAKLFGAAKTDKTFPALRVGPYHGTNYPDWFDDFLAGESKSGKKLIPDWLRKAVDQAIENELAFRSATNQVRVPITVLHQNKDLYDLDIVCIRSDVFREVFVPALHAMGKIWNMSWDT